MSIDREARAKARNPNYRKGPESTVEATESETLPEPPEQEETGLVVGKSGTRFKSKQESKEEKQKEAVQESRDIIERSTRGKYQRPKSTRDAGRDWFENNKLSVESMIGAKIGLDKTKTKPKPENKN